MKSFEQHLAESSYKTYKTVSIELQAKEQHINTILTILKTMSTLGRDGSSRTIKIFVDGDGAFKLKLKTTEEIQSIDYDDDDIEFELE